MDCVVTYIELMCSLAKHGEELEVLSAQLRRLHKEEAWDQVGAVLAEFHAKNKEFQKVDDAIRLYDPLQVPSTP